MPQWRRRGVCHRVPHGQQPKRLRSGAQHRRAPWGGCNMSIALVRLILYVHNVAAVKAFYQTHFALSVIEQIARSGWCSQPAASSWRCTGLARLTDSSRIRVHPAAQ